MLNKLIWSRRNQSIKGPQFEFEIPTGFKVFTVRKEIISDSVGSIDLGVKVKCLQPLTLLFTPAFYSKDFVLVNPAIIIPPNKEVDLTLLAVNPNAGSRFEIEANKVIANMVIINTDYANLFEVSIRELRKI